MKVLILGSTGLLGTAMSRVCRRDGIDFVAFNHRELDVKNHYQIGAVIENIRPDVVFNATGIVGINVCEDDPVEATRVNTIAVGYLTESCKLYNAILIQPSTHNVFDGTKNGYYTEEDEPHPLQIYGLSRLLAEKIALRYENSYVVRYPTLFGDRDNNRSAFPNKIFDWIREGKAFSVSYDKIDSPSYSMDVAERTLFIANNLPFGIYHVANSGTTDYYEFARIASSIMDKPASIVPVEEETFTTKAPNALKTAMSSVKLKPMRPWYDALEEYLNGR